MALKNEIPPTEIQQRAAKMAECPRPTRTPQPPRLRLVERDVYGEKVIRRENINK